MSGNLLFIVRLFVIATAVCMLFGRADARKTAPRKPSPEDSSKVELRNNAASLLADLLADEKNLGKILIIKHNSPQLGRLVKSISKTADDGSKQLEALAKNDAT